MHECAEAGGSIGLGDGSVGAGCAGDDAIWSDGDYAGQVDDVANGLCRNIVSARCGKRWESNAELL